MSIEANIPPKQVGLSVQEFELIFKEYWKDVFKICHFHTRDDQIAADLTQNIFVMVWQKRSILKDEGKLKHYLFRAAKLEALNFNRQQQNRGQNVLQFYVESGLTAGINTTEQDVFQREVNLQLQQQLERLPLKSQAVFRMSIYEGLDKEAIAHRLEMSLKNVEYHLYKAVRFIKSKIF